MVTSIIVGGTFGAGALLLTFAGSTHLRRTAQFRAVLVSHRVVPYRLTRISARIFSGVEAVVGAAGLISLVTLGSAGIFSQAAGAAVGTLYALMAVYVVLAFRRSPHARCGCFTTGEGLSYVVAVRCGVFAVAAYLMSGGYVGAVNGFIVGSLTMLVGVVLTAVTRYGLPIMRSRTVLAGAR